MVIICKDLMKNDEVFSFNDMKFYSKIVVAFIDKK